MDERLAERLRSWQAAGVIDAATAAAIAAFEAGRAAPPASPAEERLGAAEAIAYLGLAAILAGIIYAVFSGLGPAGAGPVVLALAAVAALLGVALLRDGSATSRRAAGAALAAAAGLAALGLGEVMVAAGAFATRRTVDLGPGAPPLVVTDRNTAALAAVAATAALVLGLAGLAAASAPITALLVIISAYVAAMNGAQLAGGDALQATGGAPAAVAAMLVALSAAPRLTPVTGWLRFGAAAPLPPLLLILGGIEGGHPWPLIVVAGAVAAASMQAAVRTGSNALAVAGGIGAFGVAVDVTARTLGSSGGAPVVLIVSGLLLVACAVLTQRAIRHAASHGRAVTSG